MPGRLTVAVLVVAVTIGGALLLFNRLRFEQTVVDGIWALAFLANWHFAEIGTDYFRAESAVCGSIRASSFAWTRTVQSLSAGCLCVATSHT